MASCCRIVGNLRLQIFDYSDSKIYDSGEGGCINSISVASNTEVTYCESEPIAGATTGTVSISALAYDKVYVGCSKQISLNIPWGRKWDCASDVTRIIYPQLYKCTFQMTGDDVETVTTDLTDLTIDADFYSDGSETNTDVAVLNNFLVQPYSSISASSQSGPMSLYNCTFRVDGWGMEYLLDPIKFDTSDEPTLKLRRIVISDSSGELDGCKLTGNAGIAYDGNSTLDYNFLYLQSFSLNFVPGEIPTANYSYLFVNSN